MRRYTPLLPALLYMSTIYVLSGRPAPDALQSWPILLSMKAVHLVEYGILGLLWIWGLNRATGWSTGAIAACSILITALWGVSDEFHQSFVPGRTARVEDAVTDLVAALAAVALWLLLRRFRRACRVRA